MGLILTILNRNKFLLILIVGFVVVFIFRVLPSFKSSDMGNYVAIAALALTVWQVQDTRESKIEGAIASVGKDLEEAIAKVEADSDRRDSLHDQQLSQIQQQLSSMQREVEFHRVDIGRLQDHIFENKDKLAEHGATLAVLSKQGEIILAVDNMRSEFKKLEEQIKQLTLE